MVTYLLRSHHHNSTTQVFWQKRSCNVTQNKVVLIVQQVRQCLSEMHAVATGRKRGKGSNAQAAVKTAKGGYSSPARAACACPAPGGPFTEVIAPGPSCSCPATCMPCPSTYLTSPRTLSTCPALDQSEADGLMILANCQLHYDVL